jgi:hypothetical protein
MKAILEFNLPEDQAEHSYAVAGVDALLLIDEVIGEIRSKLEHDGGFFREWRDEDGVTRRADDATLERVRALIIDLKSQRNLPELI